MASFQRIAYHICGNHKPILGEFTIAMKLISWIEYHTPPRYMSISHFEIGSICSRKTCSNLFDLDIETDGWIHRFHGFTKKEIDTLENILETDYALGLLKNELAIDGKNYGDFTVYGNATMAATEGQPINKLMVLAEQIMSGPGARFRKAVVVFQGIAVLTPRGRCSVRLYRSHFQLDGYVINIGIPYSSVVRLFVLPKFNQPHTFVVITLDSPICKGKTCYPHIVLQFETDYVVERTLSINEDLLNTKYKGRLEPSYKGLIHEVFSKVMLGLSGAKVTKPGNFLGCQDYAVKSSLKAEDGLLYPLEKCFFFLPKPPTLILHAEIDYVVFERLAGSATQCFDLLIRLKSGQEHLFQNIQRNEYRNLVEFISSKSLNVMNLGDVRGVAEILQNDDDVIDPYLERIKNDGRKKPVKKNPGKEAAASSKASKRKGRDGQDDGKKKRSSSG